MSTNTVAFKNNFKVFQNVWTMENNKPIERYICRITETAKSDGNSTYIIVELTGYANLYRDYNFDDGACIERYPEEIFLTKDDLFKSLMNES